MRANSILPWPGRNSSASFRCEAMLMAAEYYIEKENLFILDERQKIRLAVERLGLNSVSAFIPEKRIIEYMIEDENAEPLASHVAYVISSN